MVNLNKLAKEITLKEGLKKSVNIAQVREIMRIIFQSLSKMTLDDITKILDKYRKIRSK